MTLIYTLPHFGAFATWRAQARACAVRAVKPHEVSWRRPGQTQDLFAADNSFSAHARTPEGPTEDVFVVPRDFLSLAEGASCHGDDDVFDQLYRLLLRVVKQPDILDNPVDADLARILAMRKAVSRDAHKMKAFVRFKDVGVSEDQRRQFVSWFEPDHFIVEHVSGFFARRFADMDWVIETPKGCVSHIRNTVAFNAFNKKPPPAKDDMDELWRTYYANIFNPARLKTKAMAAEMPKKYWKNLPEASLIQNLVRTADARSRAMQAAQATEAPAHLFKFKAPHVPLNPVPHSFQNLGEMQTAALHCQRCTLCRHATQTVLGEGPDHARLMFVGEQPGDQEDLDGRPFRGPAGTLFDNALTAAGIDRTAAYVTNAVKHFKFVARGKRRLHQRPNAGEIEHCRWWLNHEVGFVRPRLIVAMGSTALQALTGDGAAITQRRGSVEHMENGTRLLVTYHPAAILRHPEPETALRVKRDFFSDIALARALGDIAATQQV